MQNNSLIRFEDLVNNPTARVPVCLCLDMSSSMKGQPMEELNEGVRLFYEAIREDETALYSAEICIVTFGSKVECLVDFSSLELKPKPPHLSANGFTYLGEAVNLSLDLLEKRKEEYQEKGVDYYQPWMVIMTDGVPNGKVSELNKAIKRTSELVNGKKLTVFPIGIGANADMSILKKLSPKRQPLKLQGLKFKEFFSWLSQSVSKTSQSTPGESITLDFDGIKGWSEL